MWEVIERNRITGKETVMFDSVDDKETAEKLMRQTQRNNEYSCTDFNRYLFIRCKEMPMDNSKIMQILADLNNTLVQKKASIEERVSKESFYSDADFNYVRGIEFAIVQLEKAIKRIREEGNV